MIRLLLPLALLACDSSLKVGDSVPVAGDDSQPGTTGTGTGVTESPPPDDSGTDDSGTDDSGTDDSGTDDSGTDDSGTDDSGAGPVDSDGDGTNDDEDCAPDDPAVHPGAAEICDTVDQDCNGLTDDASGTAYVDVDGDGVGSELLTNVCDTGVPSNGDCDDTDAATYPGAPEACTDDVDRDCDGLISRVDADADGVAACEDCDDTNTGVSPVATETCDGVDQDCDGEVDESAADALSGFTDDDLDGYGGAAVSGCELPAGSVSTDGDCDDTDAAIHPDATETCDSVDQDCDGSIDEDATTGATATYADADGDGYGVGSATVECTVSPGRALTNGDCDDGDDTVSPGAEEVCNGVDDDCDGSTDESAVDATTYYLDVDGDTYGSDDSAVTSCTVPAGVAFSGGDCDESDAAINPGSDEHCDGIDEDCDGDVDDSPLDGVTYYPDTDRDGWGADAVTGCEVPDASSASSGDCDDASADAYPGATELCNGADDDCDGNLDNAPSSWYTDADGDSFGDPATANGLCTPGTGQTSDASDCDDTSASAYPGATEQCDGIDNDCDGSIDNGAIPVNWYADVDGDGYGDADSVTLDCTAPAGTVEDSTDCDDGDAAINPGAMELCDGIDNNCDTNVDPDFFSSHLDSAETLWALNGNATHNLDASDGYFELTDTDTDEVGTAWFTIPVPTGRLHIAFTLYMDDGMADYGDYAGEGVTLALMDGTDTTALGAGYGELGAGGLAGYGISFDTNTTDDADPQGETVGVVELSTFTMLEEDTAETDLDNNEVGVDLYFDAGELQLFVNGNSEFSHTILGYSADTVTIGFTASTSDPGGFREDELTAYNTVDDIVIGCE